MPTSHKDCQFDLVRLKISPVLVDDEQLNYIIFHSLTVCRKPETLLVKMVFSILISLAMIVLPVTLGMHFVL